MRSIEHVPNDRRVRWRMNSCATFGGRLLRYARNRDPFAAAAFESNAIIRLVFSCHWFWLVLAGQTEYVNAILGHSFHLRSYTNKPLIVSGFGFSRKSIANRFAEIGWTVANRKDSLEARSKQFRPSEHRSIPRNIRREKKI